MNKGAPARRLRYFLIGLSFALCLIPAIVGAFMVGLGQRKQAIHDLIVDTLVGPPSRLPRRRRNEAVGRSLGELG
ncbi:MAG: hypothetical protein M3082_21575 [Candidatus Dormibacteraeota bacterium]|nr:hypothetical protein [Candidatus Dormibacteraeota bacterium]